MPRGQKIVRLVPWRTVCAAAHGPLNSYSLFRRGGSERLQQRPGLSVRAAYTVLYCSCENAYRKVRISARVQALFGAKVVAVFPPVTPTETAHRTACS